MSDGARVRALEDGWRMSLTPPGACAGPAEAARLNDWLPARATGTVAEALEAAGRWRREAPTPLNDQDAWWRLELPEAGRRRLRFEGLATLAEGWLDETPLFASTSMFQPVEAEAEIAPGAVLWICFRALGPRLSKKGPRVRWRPFMIPEQGLRLVRTTLSGHMPGWQPAIDIVGPWRPVLMIEDGRTRLSDVRLRADWEPMGGRLEVEVSLAGGEGPWEVRCAGAAAALEPRGEGRLGAAFACPGAEPWLPHTHGRQPLYEATLHGPGGEAARLGRVGFRRIAVEPGADGRGFGLEINGQPVFCRGAVWTPPDLVRPPARRAEYEPTLRLLRDAGMNMVRVSGVGVYESPEFFALCDELGILVWQDFMFANFDYPAADPAFAQAVRAEAEAFLKRVQGAPSLAMLCGGSEVMQQAAMMGLAPETVDWPVFDEILPEAAGRLAPGVPYLRNTPSGGPLPFVADEGVTHYYGVGAYERPLADARAAGVRFAAECLAFANVPQPETLAACLAAPAVHDPRWKARVPRDRGASWDFEDVRDQYLARLYGVDPYRLRREHPDLYLDLSRMLTGEAMAAVFSEWRRPASGCGGGLVWLLRDLQAGAGWGLIDAAGEPKPCWHALRRVLQPVQVLITDEGVNGLGLHVLNERPEPLTAELRLAAFDEAMPVVEARRRIELSGQAGLELSGFEMLGRFFDLNHAYRFGPRGHEAVFAQLIGAGGEVISQAVHRLAPPRDPGGPIAAELLGKPGDWRLKLTAERLQPYVHIADTRFRAQDDGFPLIPGEARIVRLSGREQAPLDAAPEGEVLTLGGRLAGAYRLD